MHVIDGGNTKQHGEWRAHWDGQKRRKESAEGLGPEKEQVQRAGGRETEACERNGKKASVDTANYMKQEVAQPEI